jgi:3-oxoacyl-[acyl-carrier protein] reductase
MRWRECGSIFGEGKGDEVKNAIVTGAAGGFGDAIIRMLARQGYHIWACAHQKEESFENRMRDLAREFSTNIDICYFDLADTQEIKEAYQYMNQSKQSIDLLINNAGIAHLGLVQMTDIKLIQKLYQVNVIAPMYLSQLVIRNMAHFRTGKIINIGSTASWEVFEGNAVYGATKAALVAFTKSFAVEVAKYGVTVNAIAPGLTDTKMSAIYEGRIAQDYLKRNAVGRKLYPQEVVDVIECLLDDKMRMVNGEVIHVTGGYKM